MDSVEEFLYTEGIQLTAAHSGGRCSKPHPVIGYGNAFL